MRLNKLSDPVLVAQSCPDLCHPMDFSPSTTLTMEFSKQEYWSGLPFPTGVFPIQGSNLRLLCLYNIFKTAWHLVRLKGGNKSN